MKKLVVFAWDDKQHVLLIGKVILVAAEVQDVTDFRKKYVAKKDKLFSGSKSW